MESVYFSGYVHRLQDFYLPGGLKDDPLAGLLSTSSSASSWELEPQTLSQARPQLYEPHTPPLTTTTNNTQLLFKTTYRLFPHAARLCSLFTVLLSHIIVILGEIFKHKMSMVDKIQFAKFKKGTHSPKVFQFWDEKQLFSGPLLLSLKKQHFFNVNRFEGRIQRFLLRHRVISWLCTRYCSSVSSTPILTSVSCIVYVFKHCRLLLYIIMHRLLLPRFLCL